MIKNIFVLLLAITFVGCAKNRDSEPVRDKQNVLPKNAFYGANKDGSRSNWLGKVTVIDTSDSPAGTLFVGYQGNVVAGYFDFTQDQLQFRSAQGKLQGVESENVKNSVLMNWNIEHIDYALDEFDGQTTNKEIVDDFKTWDQKRLFKIKWSEQKEIANAMNIFPISSFAFFSCWEPSNVRRVDNSMKIEPDHIGFNIEVVYTRLPACGSSSQWNQGDFNFTATFKYSFKKYAENKDYQTRYFENEQDLDRYKYGHFQTVRQVIKPDNGRPHNLFMENRWAEKTQHFYFVKGFPEANKWIWRHEDPHSVLGQTNALLKSIGSKLRFEIHEYNYNHDTGKNNGPEREFGDLRYSFINFIEELEAGGTPLGYGPSDTDPFTGEIIAANTMVWTGALGYYTELMENVGDLVEDEKGEAKESTLFNKLKTILQTPTEPEIDLQNYITRWDQSKGVGKLFKSMAQTQRFALPFWNSYTTDEVGFNASTYKELYSDFDGENDGGDFSDFLSSAIKTNVSSVKAGHNLVETNFSYDDKLKLQYINPTQVLNLNWIEDNVGSMPNGTDIKGFVKMLHNLMHVDGKGHKGSRLGSISEQVFRNRRADIAANQQGHCIMNFDEFAAGLAGYLQASKIDLANPKVKADFINTVLYRVSIHEFGHNLNLRHNFYGSVDLENFGLNNPKSKSIAKFKGSNENLSLEVVKKGNKEIIRVATEPAFGAVRKQVSSSVMDYLRLEDEIDTPWAWEDYDVAAIRDSYEPKGFDDKGELYLFCTDEHTATSAICNRHDLGTTPSEILMSQIRSYDERFELRNKRFGRAIWNTSGYAQSIFTTMMSMKEFLPFWRSALAEDFLIRELETMGVPVEHQAQYVELMNREMRMVMKMSMAFYQAVLQQSRGERDFRNRYDETTGALKQIGIASDKIFAMMFLAGDDAIYYNPNRILTHNSYLTYSKSPTLAEFTHQMWRNIATSTNYAMEPWFINFGRFQYAKSAYNFNNRDSAQLIDAVMVLKVDNPVDLKENYGITMPLSKPVAEMVVTKEQAISSPFRIGDKVAIARIDDDFYMAPVTKAHIAYTLYQSALDTLKQNGDDTSSITQFKTDIKELQWLYETAKDGAFQ